MSLRVLIVEDNEIDAESITRGLEKAFDQVEITLREDFESGFVILQEVNREIDLIVMDHNLPGQSGVEGCAALREMGIRTPIIVLTGSGSEYTAVQALKVGADDYIIKDVTGGYLSILVTIIPEVLQRHADRQAKELAQAEVKRIAKELEVKNRELDAFAHTVAHDLHNPLGMVLAYLTLLESEFDSSAAASDMSELFLNKALKMAQKTSEIIDGLLLFSKMKSEPLEISSFSMRDVLNAAVSRIQNKIDDQRAKLIFPDTWPTVYGYALWIEEVFVNYISNAVKYGGDPPQIEIGYEDGGGDQILFFVQDNGPGLSEKQQSLIFDPFVRLQRDKDSEIEGSGLGLSIVHRIITRLGGEVGVESQEGVGSKFYFTLPCEKPAVPEEDVGLMPLEDALALA
ncbi:MAG: hybrid sensor histidine kinase/response regulator [Chloroflexota bacterium]